MQAHVFVTQEFIGQCREYCADALEYIKWFADPEIQKRWHQQTGYVPVTEAAYETAKGLGIEQLEVINDELVRLAGALERLPVEMRSRLAERFIDVAADLARTDKHCAPYLAALALLLNRAPLHAGPESVVAPDLVERAFEAFGKLDWTHPELIELQQVFLRAARVVDNRSLDLPQRLRERIAGKLEKSGVTPQRTVKLRQYMPLERGERAGLYGEALPPGLILGD